jgi:hypothetical protein
MPTKCVSRATTFAVWPIAFALVFCCSQGAEAVITSSDSVVYSPIGSDLLGKSGGAGWNGPWVTGGFNASIHTNYDIAGGSLTYPNLAVSGERVSTTAQNAISGVRRQFAATFTQNDTETRYLSVLLRPEGTLHGGAFSGFFGLYLDASLSTGDRDLFIGKPGGGALGKWVVEERGGGGQFASPVDAIVGQTTLLVLRADFRPGNDRFVMFVNPSPLSSEPLTGIVKQDMDIGALDGIVLYSTGAHSVDEIRWGNTFADVTPVPEPGTIALFVAGILTVACAARRIRNGR